MSPEEQTEGVVLLRQARETWETWQARLDWCYEPGNRVRPEYPERADRTGMMGTRLGEELDRLAAWAGVTREESATLLTARGGTQG